MKRLLDSLKYCLSQCSTYLNSHKRLVCLIIAVLQLIGFVCFGFHLFSLILESRVLGLSFVDLVESVSFDLGASCLLVFWFVFKVAWFWGDVLGSWFCKRIRKSK